VTDPNEVDEGDPAADDPVRRQVEATLRFMATTTVVGVVIIAILAVVFSGIRGVMILVGIVYLVTSVTAYLYVRRKFSAGLNRPRPNSD
jgi:hypothetical protein